jgi:hypothetical protein
MTRLDRDKVSEPMDMNSIIRRVEVGFYGNEYDDFAKVNPFTSVSLSLTVPLLAQDVRQMWTNCQLYNPPRSPIYLSSKRFASPLFLPSSHRVTDSENISRVFIHNF